jgi:hypothetical protein
VTGRGRQVALTDAERAGLLATLDDEHRALATYDAVLRDFGDVLPFRNIRRSEARHIAALETLCRRHGVAIPDNPWHGRTERHGSLAEACAAGVAAELANAALYERLFASTKRLDLLRVYRHLAAASQQRHLPAFRRCMARLQGAQRQGPCGGRAARCAGDVS